MTLRNGGDRRAIKNKKYAYEEVEGDVVALRTMASTRSIGEHPVEEQGDCETRGRKLAKRVAK